MPDLLLPEMLDPLIGGTRFSGKLRHDYKIPSTNTAAMDAAAAGAPEGTVFLAEQQTAGRGRGANQWHSAQSVGIYCSVVLRPAIPPADILILSLAIGLAVHAAVKQVVPGTDPDLKWPNDLLIGNKKFCGILTEMRAEPTKVQYLVVGIGLNVNYSSFPNELEEIATSLRIETGREWSRVELCAALLKSLEREYEKLLREPNANASILRRFTEHSSWVRGRHVFIEENPELEGVTEGLDERGFLRIRTQHGLKTVLSGTVRQK